MSERSADPARLYDGNAGLWRRTGPSSLSDFTGRPPVLELCGGVAGLDVLDVGCGEGYVAREIRRRGAARVVGFDLSAQMIEQARATEAAEPLGISYHHLPATELDDRFGAFDLAIAVFVFNYVAIADMTEIMGRVRRVLKPGGAFVFSVPHPSQHFVHDGRPPFFFEGSIGYFSGRDQRLPGQIHCRDGRVLPVQSVHKVFQDYFDGLAAAGFTSMPTVRELTVRPEHLEMDPDFFGPVKDVPLHVAFRVTA